jgi:hypothetical protein
MRFFVTGYPRSRTAWLANFLTWGDSLCWHEATRMCTSFEDMRELLDKDATFVGNSDSTLTLMPHSFLETFSGDPLVVVERPVDEVWMSLLKLGGASLAGTVKEMTAGLETLKEAADLVVEFDELDDWDTCLEIQKTCNPGGAEMPYDRFCSLKQMNVQVPIQERMKGVRLEHLSWLEEAS